MRKSFKSSVALGATAMLVAGAFALSNPASADITDATPQDVAELQANNEVAQFWTVEKALQAKSRDVVVDGNTASIVEGPGLAAGPELQESARWTKGGLVAETTGKILFQMKNSAGDGLAYYVCSGSLIKEQESGKSVVLTASHCVYDQKNKEYAKMWVFVPNFDVQHPDKLDKELKFCDQVKYGCWTSKSLLATDEYMTGSGIAGQAKDYAFVTFGKGGKQFKQMDDVVGGQEITFSPKNGDGYAFGYPAGKPYNGLELQYAHDRIGGGGQGIFNMVSPLTGGCSGGPWFIDFNTSTGKGKLTSVNSFTFKSDENKPDRKMYGPVLDSTAQNYYNKALRMTPVPGPNPHTAKPSEDPTTGPTPTKPVLKDGQLENGTAVKMDLSNGQKKEFFVEIPEGARDLNIKIDANNGDADLYVKYGEKVNYDNWECRPFLSGSAESCSFGDPRVGTYHIMVDGAAAARGLTLVATWNS